MKTSCAQCGKELERRPCRIKERNYCNSRHQMQYEYEHGIRDKQKIVQKAHEKVRALLKDGKFYTQSERHKERMHSQTGKKNPTWKGGRIMKEGYIQIWAPSHPAKNNRGYVLEHRLIMEAKLGRYLGPEEIVHHIDQNRDNNREENLILFENDAEHMKFHRGSI